MLGSGNHLQDKFEEEENIKEHRSNLMECGCYKNRCKCDSNLDEEQ